MATATLGTKEHHFAIATFQFTNPDPRADRQQPWSKQLLLEAFLTQADSVANYWHRATCGLRDLTFEVVTPQWAPFSNFNWDNAQIGPAWPNGRGRSGAVAAGRADLVTAGVDLSNFHHLIVVYPSGPSDTGATGQLGDMAMSLSESSLPFLQHEVGHDLGFQHAYGGAWVAGTGNDYNDAYDIMGFTGQFAHTVDPPADAAGLTPAGFWQSERRLSAASLFRHLGEEFTFAGQVVQIDALSGQARLYGLASTFGPEPVLAVRNLDGGKQEKYVTIEYRPALSDDGGIDRDSVVVHSIGVNQVNGPALTEDRPAWLEGTLAAAAGATLEVPTCEVVVTVTGVGPNEPPDWVEVDLRPSKVHPFHPGELKVGPHN
jgi:hypothetical protein